MSKDELVQQIRERYRREGHDFNEAQRRRWAAQAVQQMGRGGMAAVSVALRISPNTIKRGLRELQEGVSHALAKVEQRIRRPGGGRKSPSRESSATSTAQAPHDTPGEPGDVLIDLRPVDERSEAPVADAVLGAGKPAVAGESA